MNLCVPLIVHVFFPSLIPTQDADDSVRQFDIAMLTLIPFQQGYDDPGNDEDEDDGTYADQEYGKKKVLKKKKRTPASTTVRAKGGNFSVQLFRATYIILLFIYQHLHITLQIAQTQIPNTVSVLTSERKRIEHPPMKSASLAVTVVAKPPTILTTSRISRNTRKKTMRPMDIMPTRLQRIKRRMR